MGGHTPGPFETEGLLATHDSPDRFWAVYVKASAGYVAKVYGANIKEASANADLIAAAPEMLVALRGMLLPESHCSACKGRGGEGPYGANPICGECGGSGWDERPRRHAYAAIRKAEGQ